MRICLAVLLLAAACSSGREAAPTPRPTPETNHPVEQVRDTLLSRPPDASLVPEGMRDPRTERYELPAPERRFNIAEQVMVFFTGPDAEDRIDFAIYPSIDDARTALARAEDPVYPDHQRVTGRFGPRGRFDLPVTCLRWQTSQKDVPEARYGLSSCSARIGNVVISSGSFLLSDPERGVDAHAEALLRTGIAHLRAVV